MAVPIVRILVQLSWGRPMEFAILDGIREFMRARPHWTMSLQRSQIDASAPPHDAVVVTSRVVGQLARQGQARVPVVSVVDEPDADVRILIDDARVGALAAEHFHARGHRDLVVVSQGGSVPGTYEAKRVDGFLAAAVRLGCRATMIDHPEVHRWRGRSEIGERFTALPRPCGVFCINDNIALDVLDLCRSLDIGVPEDLAVLGCDDERPWCETSLPPLSSVAIPWHRIGLEAATWIDRLLAGRRPPAGGAVVLPPVEVAARRSTEGIAQADRDVTRALRFIRQNALRGIGVKDLERAVGIYRRRLDRLFLKYLGRTPYDEICRIQLEKAKELLAHTDLPLAEIREAIGASRDYFTEIFIREVGESALAFRRRHRPEPTT